MPLIGWSLSRALARVAEVHLVTQVRNREAILRAGLVEGRDFSVIDNEEFAAPLYRLATMLRGGAGKGWTTAAALSSFSYYSFEHKLWTQFKQRLVAHDFDVVHRITPLSPTSQSIIAKRLAKIAVPFVIGPLNGGVPWPRHFIDRQHQEREWLAHVRSLYKLMPGYRSTLRNSVAIITGSKYTLEQIPVWAREKCIYIPENGVDLTRFSSPRNQTASLPLKGAFIGRLVPYKGADILIESAADFLRADQLELHIVGEGPQRAQLEALVDQLGVRSEVHFYGWVPHADVQGILRTCDFMALPSVREFGGGVVVEAMALGVTPIVADYAGPAELVNEATGIKVAFNDKKDLVEGMRRTIKAVIERPTIVDVLGAAARQRALAELTWEAKARRILSVYQAVVPALTTS